MTLGPPLLTLVKRCETLCNSSCCGQDAFDFSPIHIASFLIRRTGRIEQDEIDVLGAQLKALDVRAERLQAEGGKAVIAAMNEQFTAQGLSDLSRILRDGLSKASLLVTLVEAISSRIR